MAQHHNYSITEIENLIPYERDIYVDMLKDFLESERKRQESKPRQ